MISNTSIHDTYIHTIIFFVGLGFGGQKLSASAVTLINLVNELKIPTEAKDVVLIDVHTGLGPPGLHRCFMTCCLTNIM
jgi:hypothetical protein